MFQALDLTTVSKPTKSFTPLNLGATASAPPIAPATPAAPQGFFSNLVNGVKTFAYDFASAITAPAQNVQGPFSTTKPSVASDITLSTINSYANSLKEAGSRLSANQALFSDKTTTPLERGISTVSAGIGVLGAFLAPLSAAGAGAEKIPVLGPIATGINNLFSAIGKGGADVAQGALYSLPFISDETKAKLSPLVQETGALAAQIAAGKAGGDVYDSFVAKTKELTARLSDHVAEIEKPTPSFEPLNLQKPVEAPAPKADTVTPEHLFDTATLYQPAFKEAVDAVANSGGWKVEPDPLGVKGIASLTRKATQDYGGDASQIKDANRATIIVDNPAELSKVLDTIKQHGGDITRVKDKFNEPGYKSAIINIKSPHGHEAEIAVTTPEMWKARMTFGGDLLHKNLRSLEVGSPEYNKIDAAGHALYDRAWEDSLARLNASSVDGEPSNVATRGGKGVPVDVTAKTTSLTGSRSTLMNTPSFSKKAGKTLIPKSVPQSISIDKGLSTPSGIGKSIERKAIEAGLTEKFKNVAGYDGSTIAEQTKIFTDTLENGGVDEIRAIIRGDKPLPDRAKEFPFIVAAEAYLNEHPSTDFAYELANSPLVSAASEAGSQLGLGQNRVQDSFTARIQQIRKAKEAKVPEAPKKRAAAKKSATAAIKGLNLSELELGKVESFIDSITC